jgi:uncharacterized protein YbjT (DUF2867 family)
VIVVFGASGKTGSATVDALVERGVAFRAAYRDPAKRAEAERRGIDAVAADYDDPASLDAALAGADHVFLVAPPIPDLAELERAAIGRPCARVCHLVKISAWDVPSGRYLFTRPHQVTKR